MKDKNSVESQYLYMLKGIACYLVVFVHFGMIYAGNIYELTRIAVPIFFIIQGRFLSIQMNDDNLNVCRKKNIGKLFKLIKTTIVVSCVYIFFSFLFWVICDTTEFYEWFMMKFSFAEWIKLLIFNSSRVIYDWVLIFDHQWYLYAAITAIVIIIFLQKYINIYTSLILSLPMLFNFLNQYVFHLWDDGIIINGHLIEKMLLTRNFFFTALPFVAYGIILQFISRLSFSEVTCRRIKLLLIIGSIIGIVLTYVEYYKAGSQEIYIGSAIVAICVTTYGLFVNTNAFKVFSWIGRYLSKDIFYWHPLVAVVASRFFQVEINTYVYPFYVTILSTLTALIIYGIKRIYECKRKIINQVNNI